MEHIREPVFAPALVAVHRGKPPPSLASVRPHIPLTGQPRVDNVFEQ